MKVAIVHPWFLMKGGGEKVVDVLASMYPEADIFAIFSDREMLPDNIRGRGVSASPLNKFPFSARLHFHYMPLYPWAVESLDVREYDLVISSCCPVAMGVNVSQTCLHISYCHTPPRAWWDLYAETQARMPWMARQVFTMGSTFMRLWEFNAVQRVDHMICNSHYIANRVRQYFRRPGVVIYPPVETSAGYIDPNIGDYYLSVGRLGKQKRLDIVIRACNAIGAHLKVAGTGKEEKFLRSIAGPTIEFLGYVPDEQLGSIYARAKAFLFAADEDFGIAPVEAQSYGRPVIAYAHGGSLETVRVGDSAGRPDTGVFFREQSVDSMIEAIQRFEKIRDFFEPTSIQEHARSFDTSVFVAKMYSFVDEALGQHNGLFKQASSQVGANSIVETA